MFFCYFVFHRWTVVRLWDSSGAVWLTVLTTLKTREYRLTGIKIIGLCNIGSFTIGYPLLKKGREKHGCQKWSRFHVCWMFYQICGSATVEGTMCADPEWVQKWDWNWTELSSLFSPHQNKLICNRLFGWVSDDCFEPYSYTDTPDLIRFNRNQFLIRESF